MEFCRGIAETGISNVIARSAFAVEVDPDFCFGCETCIDFCQFSALKMTTEDPCIQINLTRCVGCGVCVPQCPDEALILVRRPDDEILTIPTTHGEWLEERATIRGIDLKDVM